MLRKIAPFVLLLAYIFTVFGCGSDSSDSFTWYEDADGDGYTTGLTQLSEAQPAGYVAVGSLLSTTAFDCDDNDATVNPGATEVCGDSIDNDCSGGDEFCPIVDIVEVGTIDTGNAADLAVHGAYLYYVGWYANGSSFGIIDFSDPTTPVTLSTMDVGNAWGIAFDGRYAYVETDGGGDGVFASGTVGVIDCLDPNIPVVVDDNNLGYSSSYDNELSGDYLYNFSDNIIGVYDVSTPTAITHVANLGTSDAEFGRAVGNYLYYGDNVVGLAIFDISDPAGLTDLTEPVGSLAITGNGNGATASGTTAFIANDSGAGTFYINSVDVSDPTAPVLISSVETTSFINYEMRVLGDYLLAVGQYEFVVIDISDPSAMIVVDTVTMANSNGWGFDVSGKYALVGDDIQIRIIQLY